MLMGSEVKSVRKGNGSLEGTWCKFEGNELYVINMLINPYQKNEDQDYKPKRKRKLLLSKKQLKMLQDSVHQSNLTIIPLSIYNGSGRKLKIEIALTKGKSKID